MKYIKNISLICLIVIFTDCQKKNKAPDGMAFVEGGYVQNNKHIGSFYIDKDLVTVAEFRKFIIETNYTTEAEIIGNGIIFDFHDAKWIIADNASWEYPNGPDGERANDNHPVRQVSWNDANKYLEWKGKRLPTEMEWEYAAMNGKDLNQSYSWGDSLVINGDYQANTWTGIFPFVNSKEDGYLQTSPVGKFNINELGLTDMGGNVWEWTADEYNLNEKVLKGGSFMCHVSYCHGYLISSRSHTSPNNALFHVGFRGVKNH